MIVRTRTQRSSVAPPKGRTVRTGTNDRFAAIQRMQERAGNRATVAATRTPVPLPPATRAEMETSFGADLSSVRVSESAGAARAGAEAVTEGNHIEFAPGRFDVSSPGGRFLLGHELTHVLQQRGGRVAERQGNRGRLSQHPELEDEADRIGRVVASGRSARVPGAPSGSRDVAHPVAQGYVVYNPAVANPAVGNYQANTTFNAQEKDATGNFLDAATQAPHIVASGLGANTPVRISSNGWIAIEDADLGNRQPKYFFTHRSKILEWNKTLMASGSFYQLRENPAETITFTWNGAVRSLMRVDAVNLNNATAADQLKTAQLCDAMVKDVIGAPSTPVPKLNRPTATQIPANPAFRALYEESLQQYFVADDLAGAARMAGHDYANPANAVAIENDVADAYGRAMHGHKGGAPDAALDQRAQQLGVNEYASPGVGEAFVTHRLGSAPKNQPVPDAYHNRIENNPSKTTMWGEHWGGVIGKDGPDTVTLENYARNGEDANSKATEGADPRFYFQMYGSGAQSWHEKWAEFHAGQRNFVNPVTLAVGRGHVIDTLSTSHHVDRAKLHFGNGVAVADDVTDVVNAVDDEDFTIAVYKALAFAKNTALTDIGPAGSSRTSAWTKVLMDNVGRFPGSRQLCMNAVDLLHVNAAARWKADAIAQYGNDIDAIKDHHVLLGTATTPTNVMKQLRKGLAYALDHTNNGRKGRKDRVKSWLAAAKAVPRSPYTAAMQALVVQTLMAVKT